MIWKVVRRAVMALALIGIVVCVALLLNFTASNPTGRRYSSEMALTVGNADAVGKSGEDILAKDLGLARNEIERQCICRVGYAPSPRECSSCFARLTSVATFRRPDFVSPDFLAESKNRGLWYKSDLPQITDYANAAKELGVPLWIFVRVNSVVPQEYDALAESTGGDVVYYFVTSPGYKDLTGKCAEAGLIGSTIIFGGGVLLEFCTRRKPRQIPIQPTPALSSPQLRGRKRNRPTSAIEAAEDFLDAATERAKVKVMAQTPDDPLDGYSDEELARIYRRAYWRIGRYNVKRYWWALVLMPILYILLFCSCFCGLLWLFMQHGFY